MPNCVSLVVSLCDLCFSCFVSLCLVSLLSYLFVPCVSLVLIVPCVSLALCLFALPGTHPRGCEDLRMSLGGFKDVTIVDLTTSH